MFINKFFDCSNFKMFLDSVVEMLPYVGESRSRFYLCSVNSKTVLVKLGFYDKLGDGTTTPSVECEIKQLEIFKREFIDKNLTPCIIELINYKICDINTVPPQCDEYYKGNIIPNNVYDDFQLAVCQQLQKKVPKLAFSVLERCDLTLEDFLLKTIDVALNLEIFKSLLFQIIFTFAVIKKRYPLWKHNDLHTNNILLTIRDGTVEPQYFQYFIDQTLEFKVPFFGIYPKIIDFGFADLPEEGIISSSTMRENRPNNDLAFLFHWIYNDCTSKPQILSILEQLMPDKLYINKNVPFMNAADIANEMVYDYKYYAELLVNPVFHSFVNGLNVKHLKTFYL